MNRKSVVPVGFIFGAVGAWAATAVTFNQTPGAGDFTTIQAATDSGASVITITDSGYCVENLEIGSPDSPGGPAVKLTSTKTGDQRPLITRSDTGNTQQLEAPVNEPDSGCSPTAWKSRGLLLRQTPTLGVAWGHGCCGQ